MAGRLRDWFQAGVDASKPAATAVDEGALYYSTDTDILYRSDGSTWTAISSAAAQITTHEADTSSAHVAQGVDITDAGGYYAATEVESALQEIASDLAAQALDDHSDVTAPAPTDGQVLTWDDYLGAWVNADGTASLALDDLTDVNAPTPGDLDVLTWNDYAGEWQAYPAQGGASALDDLTDVNAPTPGDLDVLTWNDYAGEWQAYPAQGGAAALGDLTDVTVSGSETDGQVLTSDGAGGFAFEDVAALYSDMELAYVEDTDGASITATSEAAADTVMTLPAFTVDGNTEVIIDVQLRAIGNASGGDRLWVSLWEGSSDLGRMFTVEFVAGDWVTANGSVRITPSAGSHTYIVKAFMLGTGPITLTSGAGGTATYFPMTARVTRARGPLLSAGPDTTILGTILDAPAASDQIDVIVPFDCTVVGSLILGDVSGNAVVDVWVDDPANAPPTDADSITASAPPTLSSAIYAQDTTLTGWTTALTAGQVIRFNVDSASTVGRVFVGLQVRRTVPTGGLQEGTTFPLAPTTGQRYRRTDLDYEVYFYDGTRWLSEQTHVIQGAGAENLAATSGYTYLPLVDPSAQSQELWVVKAYGNLYTATACDGSNYWRFGINGADYVLDTIGNTGGAYEYWENVIGASYTVSNPRSWWSKVGSPPNLFGGVALLVRWVAT